MGRETRVLTDGIYFGEGPRWHEGRLWFSDFWAHAIKSVSLAGDTRIELTHDERPSGLGWLNDGSLLFVSMESRRVMRRLPSGDVVVHADLNDVADFHCNDMVVDGHGRAYVGNFGFDLDAALVERGVPSVIETHGTARLALVSAEGMVSEAAGDMHFPNGSVITPDGATLIVGETLGGCLTAFDIAADGTLSGRQEWASLWPRVPDGICLDAEGAIWIANPIAPECARIAEGGDVLEVIDTGMPCFACMLGGEDGRTLFMMTAPSSVPHDVAPAPKGKIVIAQVDVPGAGRP